jgi:dimethylargininase
MNRQLKAQKVSLGKLKMTRNGMSEATTAIVRGVPETLNKCVRTYLLRNAVSVELAKEQHKLYCKALESRNLKLVRIPADNSFPDCVFVEDPAIVFGDTAVICSMGAKTRIGEVNEVKKVLSSIFSKIVDIHPPGTIEGGDVLRVNNRLFVGLTNRTNSEGINQLRDALGNEGCEIVPVRVSNILHFKSACSYLGDGCIIVNSGYFDLKVFSSLKLLELTKKEAYAANCLSVNGKVFVSRGYPATKRLIEKEGFETEELDVSEFKKCEGSLTCLSIIF